jgi:hypothetical protein
LLVNHNRPAISMSVRYPGTLVGAAILVAAAVIFGFEVRSIASVNSGWFIDELFSIWVSDPSRGFADALTHRMLTDTSPALYYFALFWTRHLITDERTAVIVLNLVSIAAALIAICLASRRAGLLGWALVAAAAFLLSGPVLRNVVEARGYAMALSVTFVTSWYCALAIEVPEKRPSLWSFGALGAIAALIHLFDALIVGCLAAGLVSVALFANRKELLAPGLTLGIAACAFTSLWVPFAMNSLDRLRWEQLSLDFLLNTYWEVKGFVFGSHLVVLLMIGFFAVGLIMRSTRPLTAAFGLAFILFISLPILASLKKPIVGARYWLMGAPSVVTFVVFITKALWVRGVSLARPRLYQFGVFAGLSLLAITDISGFFAARGQTAEKLVWSGASIAAPLLQNCPPASVHVYTSWGFVPGFAFVAHAPEAVFTSVVAPKAASSDAVVPPEAAWSDAKDPRCAVLGWAEHVMWRRNERLTGDFTLNARDDELLELLKIRALPSEVEIYRHRGGFLVLRSGTLGSR